jgi:hypothetical protein
MAKITKEQAEGFRIIWVGLDDGRKVFKCYDKDNGRNYEFEDNFVGEVDTDVAKRARAEAKLMTMDLIPAKPSQNRIVLESVSHGG